MPTTATYNSSVKDVDLLEESAYQVSKNIIHSIKLSSPKTQNTDFHRIFTNI